MLKQTLAVLAGALALSATAADLTINGVGASFPAPVYRVWTYGFSNVNKDIRVNYQPLGSGAGINQIKAESRSKLMNSTNPGCFSSRCSAAAWCWFTICLESRQTS